MVEEVTNVLEDYTEKEVLPDKIILTRTVKPRDYESLRFGGEFKIPEGLSTKEALKQVTRFVENQIDAYLSKDTPSYTERRLRELKVELQSYSEKIEQPDAPEKLKRERIAGEITALFQLLREIQKMAFRLDTSVNNVFLTIKQILRENKFELADLNIPAFSMTNRFRIEVVEEKQETISDEDSPEEDEDLEDEDEDEDWD